MKVTISITSFTGHEVTGLWTGNTDSVPRVGEDIMLTDTLASYAQSHPGGQYLDSHTSYVVQRVCYELDTTGGVTAFIQAVEE